MSLSIQKLRNLFFCILTGLDRWQLEVKFAWQCMSLLCIFRQPLVAHLHAACTRYWIKSIIHWPTGTNLVSVSPHFLLISIAWTCLWLRFSPVKSAHIIECYTEILDENERSAFEFFSSISIRVWVEAFEVLNFIFKQFPMADIDSNFISHKKDRMCLYFTSSGYWNSVFLPNTLEHIAHHNVEFVTTKSPSYYQFRQQRTFRLFLPLVRFASLGFFCVNKTACWAMRRIRW